MIFEYSVIVLDEQFVLCIKRVMRVFCKCRGRIWIDGDDLRNRREEVTLKIAARYSCVEVVREKKFTLRVIQ